MNKAKRYNTTNIDEATFLKYQGFFPKITALDGAAAIFHFEDSEDLQSFVLDFYMTSPEIPIHSWIAVRLMLKKETQTKLKMQIMRQNKDKKINPLMKTLPPSPNAFNPKQGEAYHWVSDAMIVISNVFGPSGSHQARSGTGRCFRTKQEAEDYIAAL